MQLRHRAIRCVAARIILFRPRAAFFIEVANLITLLQQLAIELFAAVFIQRLVINKGGKPRFDAHARRLGEFASGTQAKQRHRDDRAVLRVCGCGRACGPSFPPVRLLPR